MASTTDGPHLNWRHFWLSLLICAVTVLLAVGAGRLLEISSFSAVVVVLIIGLLGSVRVLLNKESLLPGRKRH